MGINAARTICKSKFADLFQKGLISNEPPLEHGTALKSQYAAN